MEHNGGNENLHSTSLCRMGCGFYGSSMFEGMCSKCHKDNIRRRQQQTTNSTQLGASGRVSPVSVSDGTSSLVIEPLKVKAPLTTPSVETATPTIPTSASQDKTSESQDKAEEAAGAEAVAEVSPASPSNSEDTPANKDKKPKKNKCHTCKKKVGLTGFPCRCGGLFCGDHRYSDKHDCSFNYKELAQVEIRKNNPVVVADKLQKI